MSVAPYVSGKRKIVRMYPNKSGCYVRLADPENKPKDDYFLLPLAHPNYNAIYSLILSAAVNRLEIQCRTEKEINDQDQATILYVTVDW